MSWKCPKCGSVDLRVNVSAVAVLTQTGDNFETEVLGDHEWGSDSTMLCNECEYVSPSFAFEVNPVCGHLSLDASVPKPPAGYTAEELERDNPYNQWMQES